VAEESDPKIRDVVQSAVTEGDIESAVIFVVAPGSTGLELAAAAGVEGPALERLIAAVRDPAHPISRTISDDEATFDVRPMNPGGPALRSHLPLIAMHDGRRAVLGVLALAHENNLTAEARQAVIRLAREAADRIDQTQRSTTDKDATG
jgi:hypothetical protein